MVSDAIACNARLPFIQRVILRGVGFHTSNGTLENLLRLNREAGALGGGVFLASPCS
jgi:hypothetical protein